MSAWDAGVMVTSQVCFFQKLCLFRSAFVNIVLLFTKKECFVLMALRSILCSTVYCNFAVLGVVFCLRVAVLYETTFQEL